MLTVILWMLSAAAAVLLCALCPALSFWWLVPLAVGAYLALCLVYVLALVIISLLLPKAEPQSHKEWCRHIIIGSVQWMLTLVGFSIRVTGAEKLPTDRPFLLVSNHRSNYDPMITMVALRRWRLAFISKPENFRIPIAGPFIRCASYLPIDREHARNAVVTIHRAAEYITDRGLCMGIYPEGTRSKTGELLPFHNGSFKIAKLAGCPIAVLTIQDHGRRWALAPRRVELHVLAVLDEETVKAASTGALSEQAEALIREDLS